MARFISDNDKNVDPSNCVEKILLEIAKTKPYIADVSLINNGNNIIQKLQEIKGFRYVTRTDTWSTEEVNSSIYVVIVKDYYALKYCLDILSEKDLYWNPSSNFVIILEKLDDYSVNITNLLEIYSIYNTTILKKEANDYSIYRFHSPIVPCSQHQLVRVAHCSNLSNGSNIFPMINERDLSGCHFKFLALNLYPLVYLKNNELMGLEEKMIRVFSKLHEINIELELYQDSGIFTGHVRKLLLNFLKFDGAIGGFYLGKSRPRGMSYSYPIFVDPMTWIMPLAKPLETWHAVFSQNTSVFFIIFILIMTFSVLAYFLELFPSLQKDATRDFLIVFGYITNKIAMRKLKTGFSERLIISILLLSAFIIPYSIQAFYSSVQTHPIRGFEPKTFAEIDKENNNLILPTDWINTKLYPHSAEVCGDRLQCLRRLTDNQHRGHYTMMTEILFQFYKLQVMDDTCNINVYALDGPAADTLLRIIYFRSGSFLVKPFDDFLHKYVSSGLYKKHTEDLLFIERLKCRYRAKSKLAELNLKELYQPFAILIFGYCVSACCFACEILANTRKLRAERTKILTYLQKVSALFGGHKL